MEHHWPEEEADRRERLKSAEEPARRDLGVLLGIGKPLSLLGYMLFLWSIISPH